MQLKSNKVVFRRHLATAKNNINRNRRRFVLPVITIFLTLTFVSLVVSALGNVGSTVSRITNHTQVTVLLEDKAPKAVQTHLRAIPDSGDVKFVSKEEQLKELSSLLSKDWEGFKGEQNPLQDSYVMTVSNKANLKEIEQQATGIDGVKMVTDNRSDNEAVSRNTAIISMVLVVVAMITLLFSSTSIASVVELSLSSRESEIEIMRLLGASKKFVRKPFEIEGAFMGAVGAVLAVLLNVGAYAWFYNSFEGVLREQGFYLVGVWVNFGIISILIIFLGVVVGSWSARMRSNKLLEF